MTEIEELQQPELQMPSIGDRLLAMARKIKIIEHQLTEDDVAQLEALIDNSAFKVLCDQMAFVCEAKWQGDYRNQIQQQITEEVQRQTEQLREQVADLKEFAQEMEDIPKRLHLLEARFYQAAFLLSGVEESGNESEELLMQIVDEAVPIVQGFEKTCSRFGQRKAGAQSRQILVILQPHCASIVREVLGDQFRPMLRKNGLYATRFRTPHMQAVNRALLNKVDDLIAMADGNEDLNFRIIGNQLITQNQGIYVYKSSIKGNDAAKIQQVEANQVPQIQINRWTNKANRTGRQPQSGGASEQGKPTPAPRPQPRPAGHMPPRGPPAFNRPPLAPPMFRQPPPVFRQPAPIFGAYGITQNDFNNSQSEHNHNQVEVNQVSPRTFFSRNRNKTTTLS